MYTLIPFIKNKLLVLLATALFFVACSEKETPQILARVNNAYLTEENLNISPLLLDTPLSKESHETEKKNLIETWITTELLYQEGVKKNLDKTPEIRNYMMQYQKQLVANQYLQLELGDKIRTDDEEINEYYFQNREQFKVTSLTYKVNVYVFSSQEDANTAYRAFLQNNQDKIQEYKINNLMLTRFIQEKSILPDIQHLFFSGTPPKILQPFFFKDMYYLFETVETYPVDTYFPIADVREEIRQEIGIIKYDQAYRALINKLRKKATVEITY